MNYDCDAFLFTTAASLNASRYLYIQLRFSVGALLTPPGLAPEQYIAVYVYWGRVERARQSGACVDT